MGLSEAHLLDLLAYTPHDLAFQLGLHLADVDHDMPALTLPSWTHTDANADTPPPSIGVLDPRWTPRRRSASPEPEPTPLFVLHGCDPLCLPTRTANGIYALGLPSTHPGELLRPGDSTCVMLEIDMDLPRGTYALLHERRGTMVTSHAPAGPVWKGRVTHPVLVLTNLLPEDMHLYAGSEVLHLEFVHVAEHRDFEWAPGTLVDPPGTPDGPPAG
jgi:hypothetical protein